MIGRREFVKSAALAGITASLAPAAANGMFLSLNSVMTGNKVPWPESARLAAQVGYGGIDLNLASAMKEGLDSTHALLTELKLRTSYCGLPVTVTGTDEVFERGMAMLEDAAAFVSAVGCGRMMMVLPSSSAVPAGDFRTLLLRRLTAVAELLSRHNVRLGLEFMGPLVYRKRAAWEFIWRMNDVLDFAKEIGPNIGLTLDSWHWHHAGATVDDIIRAGKSRIVTVHVSDAVAMAPEDVKESPRSLPGEGIVNLTGFFQALKQIGYEDGVSPEVFGWLQPGMSAEDGAKAGLEASRAVMRKAGISV